MNSLTTDTKTPRAQHVLVNEHTLTIDLYDGRTLSVPLTWFPRLLHGSAQERNKWRFVGNGEGIHWPDLDEDISVENLLAGKASFESQSSLKQWLEQRSNSTT
ncbi:DUF2442 domain-containing protein [candidate division CSSED10-310 bacterium]|uniref:DUF2442 domain-containing protein n=1 Tax=candidate division CSSED10-310 bacterium TaxID=2855610 RepID=A0ABV6YUX8_UNCC1